MIRIINYLLPSDLICSKPSSSLTSSYNLLNISIDEECFFIEYSSSNLQTSSIKQLFSKLQKNLQQILPQRSILIQHISNISPDLSSFNENIYLSIDSGFLSISFPLEFLNYISNQLNLSNSYKANSIMDLKLELLRFQPQFIPISTWYDFSEKELRDICYHMITNNLATPKMFALFFKKIPVTNFSLYFSTTIATLIQYEFAQLSDQEDPSVLNSIYYIIERNLLIYLNLSPILPKKQKLLSYYQETLFTASLPTIDLTQYSLFQQLAQSPIFSTFLQKNSHKSIVSFLKYSSPNNFDLFKKGFSKEGWKRIQEDFLNKQISIYDSKTLIYNVAHILSNNQQFEDLASKYLKKDRHWEFLAREGNLIHTLEGLETLSKHNVNGIISTIYKDYKQQKIIFPNTSKETFIQSQRNLCTMIYYLYLTGYLL